MIVDANVFHGFFQVELGDVHNLLGCPQALIASATAENPIFHDQGQIIEAEWRNLVDPDWFDGWLAGALSSGVIVLLEISQLNNIEKPLYSKGFPKSKDIIYVRLGGKVVSEYGNCDFFTEDIDFYDPKKKCCPSKTRTKILKSSSGDIAKILKKHKIHVQCVP